MATPVFFMVSLTRLASSDVNPTTSMCVTPAYRRSALPFGQHMSSTQSYPLAAANAATCSRLKSGRMALTNPRVIIGISMPQGLMGSELPFLKFYPEPVDITSVKLRLAVAVYLALTACSVQAGDNAPDQQDLSKLDLEQLMQIKVQAASLHEQSL